MVFRCSSWFASVGMLAGALCCTSPASAQIQVEHQVQVQMAGNGPMMVAGNFGGPGNPSAASVEEVQSLMELRIDALQRVAELTDPQVAKLRLAATAAAKGIFQNPEKFGVFSGKFKVGGQLGAAPQPKEAPSLSDEDAESSTEPDTDGFLDLPLMVPMSKVLEHDIWKQAEASVLSPEQQNIVAEYWGQRKRALRRFAVEKSVTQLDEMLYLTSEQRDKVTEIVDQVLGDQLEQIGFVPDGVQVDIGGRKLAADDVQQVLSPVQLARFKKYAEQNANPLAGLGPLGPIIQQAAGQALGKAVGGLIPAGLSPANERIGVEAAEEDKKVVVKTVKPKSLAEELGIQVGDVLLSINGQAIVSLPHLEGAAIQMQPNEKASIEVERSGEKLSLESK